MAIDFPNDPEVGDELTVGDVIYEWTGSVWRSTTPTEFPPSPHTHVKADITDFAHTHLLADITDYTPPVIPEVTFTNTFMLMGA
jgi:hypothetical protein